MPKCKICENCGCNLDFGESCDCEKEKGAPQKTVHPQVGTSSVPRKRKKVKSRGAK